MSDTAAPRSETGPAWTWRLLVAPAPGRLHNTLMQVAGVLIVLAVWETFRIPEVAPACYVVLFVSHEESASTITTALAIAAAGVAASFVAILVNVAGLSEPAVRITLMAVMTFGTMFLYRAAKPGPALFAAGFIAVYALTESDSLLSLSLGSATATNGNGPGTGTPYIAFEPPDETLVHELLWLVLAVPAIVVVLINRIFGRDPAVLLEDGLRLRLEAAGRWCEGRPGAAEHLEAVGRRGSPELLKLAEKAHGPDENKALVRAATRLMLTCLAAEQMRPSGGERPGWTEGAARRCAALRDRKDDPVAKGDDGGNDDQFGAEIHRTRSARWTSSPAPGRRSPPRTKRRSKGAGSGKGTRSASPTCSSRSR